VRTIAIDTQYLNATGIPLTPAATTEERFALAAGGSRLEYTLTVADPGTLTAPLTVESYRVWRPGTTVQPYGCTPEVPAP
jgi:hypothetical protein